MKQKIDWLKMTVEEAQMLASAFSLTAKCYGSNHEMDVSYLTVVNVYDDNLHAKYSKSPASITKSVI